MGKGGACATCYKKKCVFIFTYIKVHHNLGAANCMYLTYRCVKNADMKNNQ